MILIEDRYLIILIITHCYSNKIISILYMRETLLKEVVVCPRLLDLGIFN